MDWATRARFWHGQIRSEDDFDQPIMNKFIDGATTFGPWAIMSPSSFKRYGKGLGTGLGQAYEKQKDGRWLKIGG
jgi:hypothetical protein